MPCQILWEDRGVVMRYSGRSSDHEVAAAVQIAQADERFDRLLYDIHDFLGCESFSYSPSRLEEMAATDAIAARTLPRETMAVAVVTASPDVSAAVNAYVACNVNPHATLRIFSSLDDARIWLSSLLNQSA